MTKPADRIGHVINQRYEALDILGRGGQGVVYRAFDRWMQRQVAIKVLGSKEAREAQTVERFLREQQALSALTGTAAVEVLDVCRGNEGELCLVMELLIGMDLDSHLYSLEQRNERMELSRVVEIFEPIVDTLEIAHTRGIVHRDLKPANVFLLRDGGVRLLDFGMARLRSGPPLTAAGTVLGSPSFIAPEAWKGQSELVDQRADVYSLGVILFLVLAGELPFAGDSLHKKFLGTTLGDRPSLFARRPDFAPRVDEWVAIALAVDPDQRFANVRALWNAFFSAFDIKPKGRSKRGASFWATARDAVKRIAGSGAPPRTDPAQPVEVLAVEGQKRAAGADATIELGDFELKAVPPPLRRPIPAETTVELSDSELTAREDTNR